MNYMLTVLFVCVWSIAFSQGDNFFKRDQHSKLVSHYDSIGIYSSALSHADSMLSYIDFYPYDYYHAFIIAWKSGEEERALNYLTQGATKGLDVTGGWIDEILDDFFASDEGNQFLSMNDSLLQVHYEAIDKDYYNKLYSLYTIDQKIRDGSREMFYNDSLNFEALIRLSEERGFPTFPATGYGCNWAWLLIWHQRGPEYPNSPQWQRIIPLINREISGGKLRPDFLISHDAFIAK